MVTETTDFMDALVAWSRDAPILLKASERRVTQAIRLIALVRHRVHELELVFSATKYQDVVACLDAPFPSLEGLFLGKTGPIAPPLSFSVASLSANCPCLRRFRLADYLLHPDGNKQPFTYAGTLEVHNRFSRRMVLELGVLESFPHLRELRLRRVVLTLPNRPISPLHLPNLQYLRFCGYPSDAAVVLSALSFPLTTQIHINNTAHIYIAENGSLDDLSQLSRTLTTKLSDARTRPFLSYSVTLDPVLQNFCIHASRESEDESFLARLHYDLSLVIEVDEEDAVDLDLPQRRNICDPLPIDDVQTLWLSNDNFQEEPGLAAAAPLASIFWRMAHLHTLSLDGLSLTFILRFLSQSRVILGATEPHHDRTNDSISHSSHAIFPSLQCLKLINVLFTRDTAPFDHNHNPSELSPSSAQLDLYLSILDTWKARQAGPAQLVLRECRGLTDSCVNRLRQVVHIVWGDEF